MKHDFDVVIVGGGPAGSTAAIVLARRGFSVCVLEKDRHPRFHIGESILPRAMPLIRELGLEEALRGLPHVPKYGAEFGFGDDRRTQRFSFTNGLLPGCAVFNIERSRFDAMLLDRARAAGAEVREQSTVKAIRTLREGAVEAETSDTVIRGRLLIDASGQATIVGRALGVRRNFEDPALQKVAYFQHFDGVEHLPGDERGHPGIFMSEEGWFWLIALDERKTSVGFVTRPDFVRALGVAPNRLLAWAVARCPIVRERMRHASGSAENDVLSDFSYRCSPFAGPGYFMVGDAACFLDPIFSTGVTLAMMSAVEAAGLGSRILRGETRPREAQRRYCRYVERATSPFWRLIRGFYRHEFRELFVNGRGPLRMQEAIISLLAGQVFPRPLWSLRWRHRLFDLCVAIQRHAALAPHRARFQLAKEAPIETPWEPQTPSLASGATDHPPNGESHVTAARGGAE
jgi:flavin-dependent dehydrogenase